MTKIHKTTNPIEADFSRWLRDNFDGWIERVEIARGMNPGYPDVTLLLPQGWQLVELKIATVEDGVLWPYDVRASQIQFHHSVAKHGGVSFFLCGVWCGDHWDVYSFDGASAKFWESTGFIIGETCFKIDTSDLYRSLTDYVYEQLEN